MGHRHTGLWVAVIGVAVVVLAAMGLALRINQAPRMPQEPPPPALGVRVRVEVLNGGGQPGVARAATELLRDAGFDVVFFGNAGSFDQDSSMVLDRVGEPAWARTVAEALGIHNLRSELNPNLYLDVSVVLGRDWVAPETDSGLQPGTG
jgi:hypothetical protein